jgi:hypothetical protein
MAKHPDMDRPRTLILIARGAGMPSASTVSPPTTGLLITQSKTAALCRLCHPERSERISFTALPRAVHPMLKLTTGPYRRQKRTNGCNTSQ